MLFLCFYSLQLMSATFEVQEVPFSDLSEQCRSEDIRIFKFKLKKVQL